MNLLNLLKQGQEKAGRGDYRAAIQDYTQLLSICPDKPEVTSLIYYQRGVARYHLGDKLGAVQDYTQALVLNPNNTELTSLVYFLRGVTRSGLGDKQGAIKDFTQILQSNPKDAEFLSRVYLNRGTAWLSLGNKQRAIEDLNQALRANPENHLAYSTRGLVRSELGDKQGAISDFTHALRIDSNNPSLSSYRGIAFSALGDRQAAIKDFLIASVLYLQQGDTENYQEVLENLRIELSINFLERNLSGISFEGGPGNSVESAILIKAAADGNVGVAAEYYYLDEKFGRRNIDWQLEHQTLLNLGERYYDEIHIELADGTQTVIFFDITEFHGKGVEDLLDLLRKFNLE